MNNLLVFGNFISHSGLQLSWKINCDALANSDYETLARIVSTELKFGEVYGIPTGGTRLALALSKYTSNGPRLIVDDVLTTGRSMEAARQSDNDIGVVIFSRCEKIPRWIKPIFRLDWAGPNDAYQSVAGTTELK